MRTILSLIVAAVATTACTGDGGTSGAVDSTTMQLTVSMTACSYDGPAQVASGSHTIQIANETGETARVDAWKIDEAETYDAFVEYLAEEMERIGNGEPGLGPPPWLSEETTIVADAASGNGDVPLTTGTWAFACVPFDAAAEVPLAIFPAGPIEVTS
jgi:hypothetical protein